MTLTELRYVVTLAEERHFGRAAERCFVSQPSLSAAVKHLEDELDTKLFERGKGDVLLTAAGERVVAQARRVLDEAERVKGVARAARNPLIGTLRLGVIHTVAPYLLPELIAALRSLAPAMPLDVEENLTGNLDPMLRAGQIDAAIVALPFQAPGIATATLYEESFRVIVPSGHRWARRKQIAADELASENLMLLNIGHCFRDQVLEACQEFARPAPAGRHGNSLETIRSMVASGLGVSVMPATAITPRFANPLVRAIDFEPPVPTRRIVLAYREGFARMAVVRLIGKAIHKADLPVVPLAVV